MCNGISKNEYCQTQNDARLRGVEKAIKGQFYCHELEANTARGLGTI